MKSSDFKSGEIVTIGQKTCKIINAKNGWLTCVETGKCSSLGMILDNEFTVRPNEAKKI
jgi:hypothetical protein